LDALDQHGPGLYRNGGGIATLVRSWHIRLPSCTGREDTMTDVPSDISHETTLCISLSARPSRVGTRFHNHLYDALGLGFVYKACTTHDLSAAIGGIRALGIRGCGVSMPFKQACLPLVDEVHDSARAIGAVNTIVNNAGHLDAYNTDYSAVVALLAEHAVPTGLDVAVLGSGGMAAAVGMALRDSGFTSLTVVARNEGTGRALADSLGARWVPGLGHERPGVLVNATPVGMAGGPAVDDLPVSDAVLDAARVVFEVVAVPVLTPLVRAARARGLEVITGAEVIVLQATEQFVLYTGRRPTPEQVRAAAEYSRRS